MTLTPPVAAPCVQANPYIVKIYPACAQHRGVYNLFAIPQTLAANVCGPGRGAMCCGQNQNLRHGARAAPKDGETRPPGKRKHQKFLILIHIIIIYYAIRCLTNSTKYDFIYKYITGNYVSTLTSYKQCAPPQTSERGGPCRMRTPRQLRQLRMPAERGGVLFENSRTSPRTPPRACRPSRQTPA